MRIWAKNALRSINYSSKTFMGEYGLKMQLYYSAEVGKRFRLVGHFEESRGHTRPEKIRFPFQERGKCNKI